MPASPPAALLGPAQSERMTRLTTLQNNTEPCLLGWRRLAHPPASKAPRTVMGQGVLVTYLLLSHFYTYWVSATHWESARTWSPRYVVPPHFHSGCYGHCWTSLRQIITIYGCHQNCSQAFNLNILCMIAYMLYCEITQCHALHILQWNMLTHSVASMHPGLWHSQSPGMPRLQTSAPRACHTAM